MTSILEANFSVRGLEKGWCFLMLLEMMDQKPIQAKMPPREPQKARELKAMFEGRRGGKDLGFAACISRPSSDERILWCQRGSRGFVILKLRIAG